MAEKQTEGSEAARETGHTAGRDRDPARQATVQVEAGEMNVEIKNGRIHIDMPLERTFKPTKQGEHLLAASTHGNSMTPLKLDGNSVIVNLNVFTMRSPDREGRRD